MDTEAVAGTGGDPRRFRGGGIVTGGGVTGCFVLMGSSCGSIGSSAADCGARLRTDYRRSSTKVTDTDASLITSTGLIKESAEARNPAGSFTSTRRGPAGM